MSFILTVLGQLVDPLVTVARDVLFKELFEQTLILCFAFFFLPGRLPEVPRPRGMFEVCKSLQPPHEKEGKNHRGGQHDARERQQADVISVRIFHCQKLLHNNLQRKAPAIASRSTAKAGARREKLKNFSHLDRCLGQSFATRDQK